MNDTIDLDGPSFISRLAQIADATPDRCFGQFGEQPLTFARLAAHASALAAELHHRYGIQPGDRVAMMTANSPITIATLFALAHMGAVWVPLNVRQRGTSLAYVLEHCAPSLLIVDDDVHPTVLESGAALPGVLRVTADDLSSLATSTRSLALPTPRMSDRYALMYTSGTTGKPKGVEVTHAMMAYALKGIQQLCDIRPQDVFFQWEPFYHIGGAQMLLLPLFEEVSLALVERFSARRFWDQVVQSGATHIHYLGGVLQILLKQPPSSQEREHRVRIAWGGGCPGEIWEALETRFGFAIRECYGMTEGSSLATINRNGPPGSVGTRLPWFDVSVIGDDGASMPAGEEGQVLLRERVPGVLFAGYFHNPDATAAVRQGDRFLTGDRGRLDDEGNLYYLGRTNDSVRCKGENVSAWEIESVAEQHPEVESCAMIGVKAEVGEQDIKLFVKAKVGHSPALPDLHTWLSQRLAAYQCPRYLALVDEFERTPSQRIIKHRLSTSLDDAWDSQTSTP